MMDAKDSKSKLWRDAAILAVAAALLLEAGCNVLGRRTLWHRVEALEQKMQEYEHQRELEGLRTSQQLNETKAEVEEIKQEEKHRQTKK